MKSLKLLPVLAMLFFTGCLEITDKLTVNPDGSGSVHLEINTTLPLEMAQMMGMGMRGEESVVFPPLQKREAAKFFPARDFVLTYKETEADNDSHRVVIDATFKDINTLLNSKYAESHGLSLKVDGGKLSLETKSGLETPAQFAVSDQAESFTDMLAAAPGMKQNTNGPVRFIFMATLPAEIADANGSKNGSTVKWEVEKGKLEPKEFVAKLGELMRASCAASAVKFTPVSPPRLASQNFGDLQAATIKSTATVDAEKIKAAARFVPYTLQVVRNLDLSGEGNTAHQNDATLSGAILIPSALAPQEWGEVKLEEVKDSKGKSLLPKEEEGSFRSFSNFGDTFEVEEADEEDEDDAKPDKAGKKAPDEARHAVSLAFTPPEWQITEIARLKATATLLYFGGSQVVKLTNALRENDIVKIGNDSNFSFSGDTERMLSDPKLSQLGLKIKLEHAMQQEDSLSISAQVQSKGAVITALQIYDQQGKPFPTTFRKNDFGEGVTYSIEVRGSPKAPLSMAILVPESSTKVEIPILLEKIPVRAKAK